MELNEAEKSQLQKDFTAAAKALATGKMKIPPRALVRLAALYKQAIAGPYSDERHAHFLEGPHAEKAVEWKGLGSMSSEEAKSNYIAALTAVAPEWRHVKTDLPGSRMPVRTPASRESWNGFGMMGQVAGRLQGKVAIVTASSTGIGFAIALRLVQEGAAVVVSSRNKDHVDKAVKLIKDTLGQYVPVIGTVCHVQKDVDRKALVEAAVKAFGAVHILVNNAAINPIMGPVTKTPVAIWDKIMETNVRAPWQLAMEVRKVMKAKGVRDGRIVFVASIAATNPIPGLGAYSVSKGALVTLTKVLAKEWAHDGIRVNAVAPGIIRTKFAAALTSNEAIVEQVTALTAVGRLGNPVDVASIVGTLCSPDVAYVTGETWFVSGGLARL